MICDIKYALILPVKLILVIDIQLVHLAIVHKECSVCMVLCIKVDLVYS